MIVDIPNERLGCMSLTDRRKIELAYVSDTLFDIMQHAKWDDPDMQLKMKAAFAVLDIFDGKYDYKE